MSKIYLIHPVRDITEKEREALDKYVEKLESEGHAIHYPIRDVDQDQRGFDICMEHKAAMQECDEVHIAWSNKSRGSAWDAGMAWVLSKKIVLVPGFYPEPAEHKCFENVLLEWSGDENGLA